MINYIHITLYLILYYSITPLNQDIEKAPLRPRQIETSYNPVTAIFHTKNCQTKNL